MAKSKRSAALFEVIQSSRLAANGAGGWAPLARSKRWWFGLNAKKTFRSPAFPASASHVAALDPLPAQPAFTPAFTDETCEVKPAATQPAAPGAVATQAARQPIPGVDLMLDPDHQQITFKVSYNSAIVAGFTILVTIGLAFIVGRKMSHGPIAATASPSSVELRNGPAHPDVLDIGSGAVATQTELITPTGDSAQLASVRTPTTVPSSVDAQRIIGRQYVVIQIYPEKKNADDAAALLNKNNIPCTVENGLAGWASKSWWCVVGTTGFDHIRANPEYARYEAAVNRVSDEFAANSKFKKFEPRAYRWKESTT